MPRGNTKYLDIGSAVVIALTLASFVAAMFLKGLTHDLLLESGVFLVSAKLVIMAHKSNLLGERLEQRLDQMQDTLRRCDDALHGK
jgi:hypothetical protein